MNPSSQVYSDELYRKQGLTFVIFMALGNFFCNYAQYQLSPISLRIMEQYHLTDVQFATVFSSVQMPSIFLGFLMGPVVDKLGPKKVILIGMIVSIIGGAIRTFFHSFTGLSIGMPLCGVGGGMLIICISKVIGIYIDSEKTSTMAGVIFTGSSAAMLVGIGTTAFFTSVQTAFLVSLIALIIVTILWIIVIKELPPRNVSDTHVRLKEGIVIAGKSKIVWMGALTAAAVLASNLIIMEFLPQALQTRGYSETAAGWMTAVMMAGCVIGTLFGMRTTSKMKRRTLLTINCICIAVLGSVGWLFPLILAIISFILVGSALGMTFAAIASLPVYDKKLGVKYAGTGNGIITSVQMIGSIILSSYVIVPLAKGNFYTMFILSGISTILGLICVLFLPKDI